MEMGWRWDFTIEILPQMAIATLNTILAAGVGYAEEGGGLTGFQFGWVHFHH